MTMLAPLAALALLAAPSKAPPSAARPPAAAARPAPAMAAPAPAPPPAEPELVGADVPPVRTPSAPEAFGGERTGREPTRAQRVVDYALTAALDPAAHTVDGTARITWRNRSEVPVRRLYAHLYLNAFESEETTFALEERRMGGFRTGVKAEAGEWGFIELRSVTQGGTPVPWSFVHPDGGPETDRTVVALDLPAPVPPGGEAVLEVAFHDQLPRVRARTGWFGSFHLAGQWYPKLGVLELPGERGAVRPRWNCHEFHLNTEFYADFGAYDLEITAPEGVVVGASGLPVGAPAKGAAGVVHRFRADDVHDVAFTAWDGFAPPLEGATTVPGTGEVRVEVLYPPEYRAGAEVALQATLDSLQWFSAALGPYPYPKVTVVVPPFNAGEAGGMEYETFFTTAVAASGMLSSAGVIRFVTVHEFGHGYFMGLLASNEFEEPMLDEGLNEWLDVRMLAGEQVRVPLPAPLRWLGLELPPIGYWTIERLNGTQRFPADPIGDPAWGRWSTDSYGQVYFRTALAMHDLEQLIGAEATDRALRLYYRRWHFRHPSIADLEQAYLDAGADAGVVRHWFDEQVRAATPIDDRIIEVSATEIVPALGSEPADGKRSERTAEGRSAADEAARAAWRKAHPDAKPEDPGPFPWRSVVRVRRMAAHVPRTVEVTFEDGSVEKLAWPVEERWGRFELIRPVRVRSARLDTAGTLFLDLNRLDDARAREDSPGPAVRVAAEAAGWLQLLLALVEAL